MEETQVLETSQATSEPATTEQTNNFTIPEAYKDRGWVSKVHSNEDLWKAMDNAQSLIGKKEITAPADDAPQEEWNAFFDKMRPKDGYSFSDADGVTPEQMKDLRDSASEIFMKYGLTKHQANGVLNDYIAKELGAIAKNKEAGEARQKELDAEFDKIIAEQFGDQYEAKAAQFTEMINKHVPESLRAGLQSLGDNPQALAGAIAAIDGVLKEANEISKKYGVEDHLAEGQGATQTSSLENVRSKLASLRASPAAKDFTNPAYKKTIAEIEKLSSIVQKSLNKA